jgi:hypothetical protein
MKTPSLLGLSHVQNDLIQLMSSLVPKMSTVDKCH